MIIVMVESPYRGRNAEERRQNAAYARLCCQDALERGELPIATHLMLAETGVLDEADPQQREWGLNLGHAFRRHARLTAFYTDLGFSPGMDTAHQDAIEFGCPVEQRRLRAGDLQELLELPGQTEERAASVPAPPNAPNAAPNGESSPGGFLTKDSGARETWATGSRRDTREGKGRYDLLPPAAILRLAQLYQRGAAKYGDRNWEKGQPISRFVDSGLRHLFAYLGGARDEDHLAAAAWNALGAIQMEVLVAEGRLPGSLLDIRASK